MTFIERPTGCAAQLLVETHRNVERHDDIGQIDTASAGHLIAAHTIAKPVLAEPYIEEKGVVRVGGPPCLGTGSTWLAQPEQHSRAHKDAAKKGG